MGSSLLRTLLHLIPTITLRVRNYSPHFTDETKRGEVSANRWLIFCFLISFGKWVARRMADSADWLEGKGAE